VATATPTATAIPTATATATPTATATLPAVTTLSGVAVLALSGATDAAWPLAQAVYGDPALRSASIDEARARVLCGEAPSADAPSDVRDLFATAAAVRGDDPASRALLGDIARRFSLRAILVVRLETGGRPVATVFLAETGAFDVVTYGPDEGKPPLSWAGAMRALDRSLGSTTHVVRAPPLATQTGPVIEGARLPKRHFYESPWFWGALAAAAFGGGAVYLATRDNGPATIHLELQVPH
jgi:hypothetical protein